MFKVNNKDTRVMPMSCPGFFIVNFEHISICSIVSAVYFEQVNAGRVTTSWYQIKPL